MKLWLLAAVAAVSGTQASAQRGGDPVTVPVTVEVIGTGSVEIKAAAQRIAVTFSGRGATMAAAEAARSRKEGQVLALLAAEGVPATAILPLPESEQTRMSLLGSLGTMGATTADQGASEDATEEARGGRIVQAATMAQVDTLTRKLKAIGVQVGTPAASFEGVAAARRDARLGALRDARVGADRYAVALGMKVGGVRRVSETGDGPVMPGLQEKLSTMLATGSPSILPRLAETPKESATIYESVVAEFALLP
ncbi:SIMPL domain-containing protein [Sphingomonas sp.]|uniref:SIMPL domain-containing protein n=1 Tax=Sphingomonas sp. TaxID=28214 RepID=UPI003B005E20